MIAFGIATFPIAICLKTNPDPKGWACPNAGMAQCQAVLWVFCLCSCFFPITLIQNLF